MRLFLLLASYFTMSACAIFFVWSLYLWQEDGIFWYGIGLIILGMTFEKILYWFLKG